MYPSPLHCSSLCTYVYVTVYLCMHLCVFVQTCILNAYDVYKYLQTEPTNVRCGCLVLKRHCLLGSSLLMRSKFNSSIVTFVPQSLRCVCGGVWCLHATIYSMTTACHNFLGMTAHNFWKQDYKIA